MDTDSCIDRHGVEMMRPAVCFGEVLWDRLPAGPAAGGAPMNAAIRLRSLGIPTEVISSVGRDAEGERLLSLLRDRKVGTELIQQHSDFATGTVNVFLNAEGSASYEICAPSAWDAITCNEKNLAAVRNSSAFIYGSLACRHSVSRQTLLQLLKESPWSIFDVNLRPPFDPLPLIDELMLHADVIKLNDDELRRIAGGRASADERAMMKHLAERSGAEIICVTRGKYGAALLFNGEYFEHQGFIVPVADTVGSGDSFLAGLHYSLTNGKNPVKSLEFSCALGALTATKAGATPEISPEEILQLIRKSSG